MLVAGAAGSGTVAGAKVDSVAGNFKLSPVVSGWAMITWTTPRGKFSAQFFASPSRDPFHQPHYLYNSNNSPFSWIIPTSILTMGFDFASEAGLSGR